MKVGIVIAIAREFKAFLESGYKVDTLNFNGRDIYKTEINNNEVYAIKSGYGEIDAASATQVLISNFGCETILNYGVTGALDKSLKVNDLFVVERVVVHDYDVSPIDPVKKCQYEEFDDIYMPLNKDLIDKAFDLKRDLKKATVASGNKFVFERSEKGYFNTELRCNICDMEIGAIVRTCYLNNVKVFSIKSISDELDGDGKDFNENCIRSAKVAFEFFKRFLNVL